MEVAFECIICGETAVATVSDSQVGPADEPLRTVRECPDCGIETIWIQS
ncbi:MAG: hypothetical protein J07HX64_02291 [halophilic archaeon J07HX64]|nr:MAG: hypothetical protein J07HX64_02291 [halophilic archaeon J07HX64]